MKTHNRISILILILLTLAGLPFLIMAEPADQDQIAKIVQEKVDEKNYTRIPNKDFDNLVEYKIAKILDDKLSSWLTLMGAFLAMVGGLITVAMSKFLNDAVTKNVKSTISEKSKELENLMETKLLKDRSELESIKEYINSNKNIIYEITLHKITDELTRNPKSETLTLKLANLLENVSQIEESNLFSQAFEQLINIYYTQSKDKEIEYLMEKYHDKNNISYVTFFTAALPHFNSYELTSSKSERNKALEYLDKSLEVEATYGIALAGKLELFMMDYLKEKTDFLKKQALENINEVFTQALANLISSNETAKRLQVDKNYPRFSKYIELLSRLFADKMSELELKVHLGDEYLKAQNANDRDKMDSIMQQFQNISVTNDDDVEKIKLQNTQNHQNVVS